MLNQTLVLNDSLRGHSLFPCTLIVMKVAPSGSIPLRPKSGGVTPPQELSLKTLGSQKLPINHSTSINVVINRLCVLSCSDIVVKLTPTVDHFPIVNLLGPR
jgi:hypothetical protein